jgi:hypothetical protein
MVKANLYYILKKVGQLLRLDIRRFPTRTHARLINYLAKNDINYCFDVGANIGQYGKYIRSIGFKGKIFSFEPQKEAFKKLLKISKYDSLWQVYNLGISNVDGIAKINISKNSVSSSLLDIEEKHISAAPDSKYIGVENINVSRIDTFIKEQKLTNKIFLKIDAQGFESLILEGTEYCISQIYALQIEISCVSLYKGEMLLNEMKDFIESKGFYLSSIESGFADVKDGRLLQVEAVFLREINNLTP